MAKQTKRILKKKAAPRLEAEQEARDAASLNRRAQYKPWETYMLVAVMCLTLFLLGASWDMMDWMNRGMYLALLGAMSLMYAQRKMDLTANQAVWVGRGILVVVALAFMAFGVILFNQYRAG